MSVCVCVCDISTRASNTFLFLTHGHCQKLLDEKSRLLLSDLLIWEDGGPLCTEQHSIGRKVELLKADGFIHVAT